MVMCRKIFTLKNGIILVVTIFIIGSGIVTYKFLDNKKSNEIQNNEEIKENVDNNNQTDISNNIIDNEVVEPNNNDSSVENKENDTTINNTTKPKNEVKPNINNTTKPNNNGNSKPNNGGVTNNSNNSNNQVTEPNTDKPKVKGVCTNSNAEWNAYITKWKSNNPEAVVFATKAEAIAYGKYAMNNYGYAYEYNDPAIKYENDDCKMEIWYTRLSTPKNSCVDSSGNYNKQIWLKATNKENLVDIFDYLRGKGYDCGNKQW